MRGLKIGQRWISDTESELGIGTLIDFDQRTLSIRFPNADTLRHYAINSAPVTRVEFRQGDEINDQNDISIIIDAIDNQAGLLLYHGTRLDNASRHSILETELSFNIHFKNPKERLFAGQVDSNNWFELRGQARRQSQRLEQSAVRGLCGPRVGLLPHQFYIAHEVGQRYAPRVLLADEVGLGKTIEAGLIVHQQVFCGRASRVLILVPESLIHQWLVEMLRRFNMLFSIFDQTRYEASQSANPFLDEQWVLCSSKFLFNNEKVFAQALAGEWDILVVDEAHHIEWHEDEVSPEYKQLQALSSVCKAVLLLTATPEQLGVESHFARLHLLDPHRFNDLRGFIEQELGYERISGLVDDLLSHQPLSPNQTNSLKNLLPASEQPIELERLSEQNLSFDERTQASQNIIDQLLDQHGTGRVLFRNTRKAIKGFPSRQLISYPLPPVAAYQGLDSDLNLFPECLYQEQRPNQAQNQPWWRLDPRIACLIDLLDQLKNEKILVICSLKDTLLGIEEALRNLTGVPMASFHEDLSIVERDRAAAYFAEPVQGARLLLCSEIGSEGRNFQFCHHLFLFDLPFHPDLLEQRIGRLDRIGQSQDIFVHVPYLEQTNHELLYRWYHEGLNLFLSINHAAGVIFDFVQLDLLDCLSSKAEDTSKQQQINQLINKTQQAQNKVQEKLAKGRDRLLEIHSYRPEEAGHCIHQVHREALEHSPREFLLNFFQAFGLDCIEQSPQVSLLKATELMLVERFPDVEEEGTRITFDRDTALAREDCRFITWEHPITQHALDFILTSEFGNTSVVTMQSQQLASDTLIIETLYVTETIAPPALQASRFIPPSLVHELLCNNIELDREQLKQALQKGMILPLEKRAAQELIKTLQKPLHRLIEKSQQQAQQQLPELIAQGHKKMLNQLTGEIKRLVQLKELNGTVRQDEIDFMQEQVRQLYGHIKDTRLRLDAIRVILVE